jgi:heptaprenyl diphosphate synthase
VQPKFFHIPELERELARLESALRQTVISEDPFLSEISSHLVAAGGKRIRPLLAIQSSLAVGGTVTDEVIQGGVAVELVHLASLHHDDVMDEAAFRRGVPSVNSRWGNLLAVVTGDYLLAKAAGIAASLSQEIAQLLADTLADMCTGQVQEVKSNFELTRTEASYLAAISGKTASLMATSCRIGALLSTPSRDLQDALTELGQCIGMIFQIRDDIFDLVASESQLGKRPGQDLVEGVYTLPIIAGLNNPSSREALMLLLDGAKTRDVLASTNDLLRTTGAFEVAFDSLTSYLKRAEDIAESIDNPPAKQLAHLASELVDSVEVLLRSAVPIA